MSAKKMAVKQTRVLGNEPIEGVGIALRAMERHQMHPAARDRLVVLVGCAMQSRDMPNCRCHGTLRLLGVIHLKVTPGQLQMLAVTEPPAHIEDRAKNVKVLFAHGRPTV